MLHDNIRLCFIAKRRPITMPKYKSNATLGPHLTARSQVGQDRERRFIQLGSSLLHNKNFQSLSSAAQHLYFCMCMDAGASSVFRFRRSDALRYGIAYSTFLRSKNELLAKHFIGIKSNGRWTRTASCYVFDLSWKAIPNPAPWPALGCALTGAAPGIHVLYLAHIGTSYHLPHTHWMYQNDTVQLSFWISLPYN